MATSNRRGPNTLSSGLDRDVHQFVQGVIQQSQNTHTQTQISCSALYEGIRNSNSYLSRKPKRLLEDSIERVLEAIRHDTAGDDVDGTNVVQMTEPQSRVSSSTLNRSIVAAWSRTPPTAPQEVTHGDSIDPADQTNGDPPRKKRKRGPNINTRPPTNISLDDLGGVDDVVRQFREILFFPLMCPETYANLNMQPVRGILIHGPPGCGKTAIAHAIAATFGVNFIEVSAPSVVSGMSGESEKALRDHFEEAKKAAPCILFIDEIDAITPKRENSERQMEKRIVAQLATCMDGLDLTKTDGKMVIVLAATNRIESLDPGLRRGGRFDKEISMQVPNEAMRRDILVSLTRTYPLSTDVDLLALAKRTPGFVGADLRHLVMTACNGALMRVQEPIIAAAMSEAASQNAVPSDDSPFDPELKALRHLVDYCHAHPHLPVATMELTQTDFLASLPQIKPSALREGFATIPNTTFASIGALTPLINKLTMSIIQPIREPKLYASVGIPQMSGALLFGPPGCGKTLLAKAVANASAANFISVKGPELLNKYVGESERAVRQVFSRARASVPVIIFFDEMDSLAPKRDSTSNDASTRVVNTLLTELDGAGESREGIYVIAATNRPDLVDPAILRPGRLETMLYVGLPDADGRVEILKALCRSLPRFEFTPKMEEIARACEGFSGADLESMKQMAGFTAVKRHRIENSASSMDDGVGEAMAVDVPVTITEEDFEAVRKSIRRSVSEDAVRLYERMGSEWQRK